MRVFIVLMEGNGRIHFHDFSSTLHSLQTFRKIEYEGRDFSNEIEKKDQK